MTPVDVLIVDDAPDVRRLLRAVLEARGGRWRVVAEASDGRMALEAAQAAQPDVVLLDLSLPVMDGLEALPLIRQAAPSAVVVVVTGFPSEAASQAAFAAGAHAYVEKNGLARELVPRLEAVIGSAGDGTAMPVTDGRDGR